ncbi:hypothetical protein SPRG_03660 [Saprolegnia parasitica CBS 223.65]|uniref:Uncharacterized protein n=1 Tax=Saprolegnia parasitica (strain CBS 223.65) TaxID=695850 RepID=A0A067CR84_SAPPC|nr:hypothetical protein SPRG_03660 [Saprolegnia parasitica CBS 223.65]KDO31740.1 hypothetical protein SPRG_03660 [Saprolegnia parasitica CBS 223.65]|eukprot:XP_012197621.1 hypothetical protein SPRG_03660 [Saprolegnia parasitica CBS 223.65]
MMETIVAVHHRCVLLPAMRTHWRRWRRFAIAAKHQAIYDHRIRTRCECTSRHAAGNRRVGGTWGSRLLGTTPELAHARYTSTAPPSQTVPQAWRQWARLVYQGVLEEQVAALAWVVQHRRAVTCQAVVALLRRLVDKARTRRQHEAAAIAQYVGMLCAAAVRRMMRCHASACALAALLAQRYVRMAWARWVATAPRRVQPPAPLRRRRWVPRPNSSPLKLKPTWRP